MSLMIKEAPSKKAAKGDSFAEHVSLSLKVEIIMLSLLDL